MGLYAPTVWEQLLLSDRSAWDGVKDDPLVRTAVSDCGKWTPNLTEQAFYGLFDPLAELSQSPPSSLAAEAGLMRKALETDEYRSLRDEVFCDRMASLLASASFSRELLATLPDDVKQSMEDLERARERGRETAEADPGSPEAEEAEAETREALERLSAVMEMNGAQIENAAALSMDRTNAEIREGKRMLRDLGFAPEGGKLSRTDLSNMLSLSSVLSGDPALKRMLDLIGSLTPVVSDLMKKSVRGREQLVEYSRRELDLEDLSPEEYAGLGAPQCSALRTDFLIRLADRELLHAVYEGEVPEGMGPVIILRDTSGSMEGGRQEFAAALEFSLMTLMMKQGRPFISIPFSGTDCFEVWEPRGKPEIPEIMDHLSLFYGGGTDPYPPLSWALTRILSSRDMKKAGILIITDGEFEAPPDRILEALAEARENPGVTLHALVIGSEPGGLAEFADRVVLADDSGEDIGDGCVREVLGGLI